MFKKFFFLFFLLLNISPSHSEQDTKILYESDHYIYKDSTKKLTIADVSAPGFQDKFKIEALENTQAVPSSAAWIKFQLKNKTQEKLFLSLSNIFSTVVFYYPTANGKWVEQKSGFLHSYKKHKYKSITVIFDIPPSQGLTTYYLKIETEMILGLGFHVEDSSIFSRLLNLESPKIFLCGLIFMVFVYSLIFFLFIREQAYFYYACYAFCFGVYALVAWELVNRLVDFETISFNRLFYSLPFSLMTIFQLLYTISFLQLKKSHSYLSKIIYILIAFKLLFILSYFFVDIYFLNPVYDSVFLFAGFIAGVLRLKDGFKPARYFVIGNAIFFIGLISHSLIHFGIKLPEILTLFNFTIIEMIFFSIALADRFKIMKQEKEIGDNQIIQFQKESIAQFKINEELKNKVNKELEAKVEERTDEIRRQALEIERMNALLLADNKQLGINNESLKTEKILQKVVSVEEFYEMYPDDDACYKFLYHLKWKDGFVCKKCKNTKFSSGNVPYSCKCSRCNYIETPKVNTIFNNIKFPIVKAFYILLRVNSGGKINIDELANSLQLRRQTCSSFIEKARQRNEAMKGKRSSKEGWVSLILDN